VLEALPGAQIVVTCTQRGTVTDANGRFEIELGANENQLTVSFLGYETHNVNVNRDGRDLIIRLNPSALGLQEIRVVGFQTERSLQQTAASLSVISPRDIARHNAVTLQPILNTIPGVRIDQAGLENQRVTIRGIGTNSNAGVRGIKIYLNEIPFTEPDGFSRMEAIDFAEVGRVEVIRGPGSSIYGAANGGVLNLTTQRAEYDDTSLTISSLLGSYGLSRNNVIFKSGTDRSIIFVSYNTQSWDGFRDWNSSDRKSMNYIGQFFVGDEMTVNALFSYLDDQNQNPYSLTREQMEENPRQEALITGVPGQPSERRASYWNNRREQDWVRFDTSVKYDFTDELTATGSVFGGFYDQVFTVPNVNIVQAEAQSYGSRALLNYRPKIENLGLVFQGGGLEYQTMRQPGNNRAFNAAGDPAQLQLLSTNIFENMTFFLQAEVELTPKTIFTEGFSTNTFTYGRVDYLGGNSIILPPTATSLPAGTTAGLNGSSKRKFDNVFTPRVALSHIFSDALAAPISYST
jgi:iron complex outermembrane receptor protein